MVFNNAIKTLLASILLMLITILSNAQDFENKSATERLLAIGEAFIQAGNTDKALGHFEDAVNVAITTHDKWIATNRLATLYAQKKRYQDALTCYDILLSDESIQNDQDILMYIYGSIGYVYYQMQDYIKSIKSYNKAKKYVTGNNKNEYLPTLYCNISKTLLSAGDIKQASILLDSAEYINSRTNNDIALSDILETKSLMYSITNDYKSAYEYQLKHNNLYKDIQTRELTTIMNSTNPLEVHQRVEAIVKYEKQINDLNTTLESTTYKLKRASHFAYIICIITLFLLGIVIWQYTFNKRNKKKVKILSSNNEEKKRVLAIVAHDFVNPFNSLIGFTEMQLQYAIAQDDKEQIDYSRMIYNSSQVLYQLVGNVLAWSQLDGQLKPKRTQINLAHALDNTLSVCRLMAEDKGVHVSIAVDDDTDVFVDETHFCIIMRNLIINAIKFTQTGGRIAITSVVLGSKTSITIDDTGIGMPQSKIDAILEGSSIETAIGTNSEKGMGLGLIICRDLIKANHGILEIKSTEGKGTTITITLNNVK